MLPPASGWVWRQHGPLNRWYPTKHYMTSKPRRPRLESSPPWEHPSSHCYIKGKGRVVPMPKHQTMREWRYSSTHSLTAALDEGELSAPRPGYFTPKERAPGTQWKGGWVGPRAVLGAVLRRIIATPCRESNSWTPIVQPVAKHLIKFRFREKYR
jgi:hypothetical protein